MCALSNTVMNMSQSYNKSCMYCNETIEMNDKTSGKWLPYNMDGTQHDCRNQKQVQGPSNRKVETNNRPLTLEELDVRVKRLESIVIDPRK
jgi:hypothetical protein